MKNKNNYRYQIGIDVTAEERQMATDLQNNHALNITQWFRLLLRQKWEELEGKKS